MVSVASHAADEGSRKRYALYLHSVSAEPFRVIQLASSARLLSNWCYLLPKSAPRTPLCLAPMVASWTCQTCGRVEVGIADRVTLGPKHAEVQVFGVPYNHESRFKLPSLKPIRSLHAAITVPHPKPQPPSPVTPVPFTFPFPPPLLDAHRTGKLAILFGSGLSLGVPGAFPRWDQLPGRLLDEAAKQGVWTPKQIQAKRDFFTEGHVSLEVMLAELDTLKAALGGYRKYRAALASIFRPDGAAPGDVHRAIAELGVSVLLTTNYDLLMEAVEGPPARMAYTWQASDKALDDIQEGRKVLFKIHGSAEHDESVIMTRAEYDRAAAGEPYQRTMSHLLQTYTFLLVGFGMNDPLDLDLVFGLNTRVFGSAARPHYALMRRDVRPNDRDRWQRDMNVQVLPYDDHCDLPAILRALRDSPRSL